MSLRFRWLSNNVRGSATSPINVEIMRPSFFASVGLLDSAMAKIVVPFYDKAGEGFYQLTPECPVAVVITEQSEWG